MYVYAWLFNPFQTAIQDLVATPDSAMRDVNAFLDLPSPASTLPPLSRPPSIEEALAVRGHEWETYGEYLKVRLAAINDHQSLVHTGKYTCSGEVEWGIFFLFLFLFFVGSSALVYFNTAIHV